MNRAQKRQQQKLARKTARQKVGTVKVAAGVPDEFLSEIVEKGVQAHRAGRLGEAESLYRQVLDNQAGHGDANHLMGLIAHQVGRNDRAIQFIKKAIRANPDKAAYHANLGPALQKQGRLDDAISSCRTAIDLDPEYVEAHANLANALQNQGKLDEAVASYRQAIAIDPDFAEAHNNLGNALKEQGLLDDALACYRHALSINSDDAEAHYNIGFALQEQGQFEAAMTSYRKVLEINPDFALAHYNLSNLYEKTFQLDEADYHIRQALKSYPDHPGANVSLAVLMRRRGDTGAAIERLEALTSKKLADRDACRVHFELGKLYDLELDSARAFTHFTLANAAQARDVGHKAGIQAQGYRQFIEKVAHTLNAEFVDSLPSVKPAPTDQTPVFLVGFPRSGTTLLDQILDTHPRIQVMEENPAMDAVRASIEAMSGGYPRALAGLKEADILDLRAIYRDNVEHFLQRLPGAILIDKLPLNITNIPLIVQLFPDARFILALRHPLDVILSNFMQFFQLNDATSNFLTIGDAATIYRLIMNFWRQCAGALGLNFHTIKYEDLVADMEGESRSLIKFLGIQWDENVLDYRTHARQRGVINTPSYAQVTEPIYQRAKYRWMRYNKQLGPIINDVQPLAEVFGYACTTEGLDE
ncbi:MAG: tetratricopeptide repeat protein [Rhodospirillales bacterium]|nr:tetratricopeptide repeat protein [Rhodospirillales bacterium]